MFYHLKSLTNCNNFIINNDMAKCEFLVAMLHFARLDFSTFLICYSGDVSGNKSEEKASVAIYGGSRYNLA